MLQPLRANERRSLLRLSFVLCSASLLVAPLTLPASFEAQAGVESGAFRQTIPQIPDRLVYPQIDVTRDPFAADRAPVHDDMTAVDGLPIVLPANRGADAMNQEPGHAAVRAVIQGSSPQALIDIAGRTEVVGIGSAVAGSSVVKIDPGGVLLENGTRLPFEDKEP